jgi:hypothetical protein
MRTRNIAHRPTERRATNVSRRPCLEACRTSPGRLRAEAPEAGWRPIGSEPPYLVKAAPGGAAPGTASDASASATRGVRRKRRSPRAARWPKAPGQPRAARMRANYMPSPGGRPPRWPGGQHQGAGQGAAGCGISSTSRRATTRRPGGTASSDGLAVCVEGCPRTTARSGDARPTKVQHTPSQTPAQQRPTGSRSRADGLWCLA